MFGTQTRFFAVAVVVVSCAAAVLGATKAFKATFTEVRDKLPHAELSGTLYYKYDDTDILKSRLRMEYNIDGQTVANLYDFEESVMYSMCSKSGNCTGKAITEIPDPWYFDSQYYSEKKDSEGFYVRNSFFPSNLGKITNETHRPQVKRIKLGNKDKFTTAITRIDFSNGGNVTITSKFTDVSDTNIFVQDKNKCPDTAKCPVFADLVFVLDNSKSVDDDEWSLQAKFVRDVLRSFEFGSKAMEAAIVEFNSPEPDSSEGCMTGMHKNWRNQCVTEWFCDAWNHGCGMPVLPGGECNETMRRCQVDFKWANNLNYVPNSRTADYIAARTINGVKTVTDSLKELEQSINYTETNRPTRGHTCQGFGLELALNIFQNSPRNPQEPGDPTPSRIVIAVTDGEDECPVKCREMAETLKNDWNVYLIEIGVGMSSDYDNYNRKFLEELATKISADQPAYYSVDDYNAIVTLSEKLFKPICEEFSSDCGGECKAFCGCGECLCPSCVDSDSDCFDYECGVGLDGTSSNGCTEKYDSCTGDDQDDICVFYNCYDNGGCKREENECQEVKDQNPGSCRTVECDSRYSNQPCQVKVNDTFCQEKYAPGNLCLKYECTPAFEPVPKGFEDTGCRLVKDVLEEECKPQVSGQSCKEAYCNPKSGKCAPKDKCLDQNPNPNCYSYTCKKDTDNQYKCIQEDVGRSKHTKCTKEVCKPDGWQTEVTDTNTSCKQQLVGSGVDERCRTFYCDPDSGCQYKDQEGCSVECLPQWNDECVNEGWALSRDDSCVSRVCATVNTYGHECRNFKTTNCLTELASAAREKNQKSRETKQCWTPRCAYGGTCELAVQTPPSSMKETACMEPVCVENKGVWEWKYQETETKKKCKTDACFERSCDDYYGCLNTSSLCTSKSTVCTEYTCEYGTNGVAKCQSHSLLMNTYCAEEICVNGNEKVLQVKDLTSLCPTDSKCILAECKITDSDSGKSECQYKDKPKPPACLEDPCLACTCDKETGEYDTETPKCLSGDNCTVDSCNINGKCGSERIDCYDIVDMSAFPCFSTECTSDRSEKGFKCLKKLLPNAYIDVCGECVKEEQQVLSSDTSVIPEEEQDVGAVTDCTGAPARPLLTEGLAAASVALIILAAVVVGAAIAASTVMGTKTLIDRAKGANNQSAHTNPLFEETETEMTNPAFIGE